MGFWCLYIMFGVMVVSGIYYLEIRDYSRATTLESWFTGLMWPIFVLFFLIALISIGFVLIYEVYKWIINGIRNK